MYDDVEADFWKELFVHLQHKNMVRAGAERLTLADCPAAFNRFALAHPDIPATFEIKESSAVWEVPVTSSIHLRLFIQNQIKASLLQRQGSDFVKIADAKFPYNPFPEITEFLSRRDSYQVELHSRKELSLRDSRRTKLAEQFIRAYLQKKFGDSGIAWQLEIAENQTFTLITGTGLSAKKINLTAENFISELSSL